MKATLMKIISANRLDDGLVVFLTRGTTGAYRWSFTQDDAAVATSDLEIGELTTVAQKFDITDQYATGIDIIDVVVTQNTSGEDCIKAVKFREEIRANGPTVQKELNRSKHIPTLASKAA
jgi:hypothetical protein